MLLDHCENLRENPEAFVSLRFVQLISMSYPSIVLKRLKEKSILRRHPWIFSGAIERLPEGLEEGQIVELFDAAGQYLATGHYQIGSIAVRICSFTQGPLDRDFWREKLARAIGLRTGIGLLGSDHTNMLRLVHGEGDGFPGLIIDWYAGVAVIQCHSVGFYHIRELLAELLRELMAPTLLAVYDKSEHTLPFKAQLHPQDSFLWGDMAEIEGKEYGNRFYVQVEKGQKTGFFLDQRENRRLLGEYARGRRVLNTFSYSGGFSIYALRAGAELVHSVDSSQQAIDLANRNAVLNGDDSRHEGIIADVFKFLQDIDDQYDLIVLDPPAFAKHQKVLDQALRGYRTINHKAFQRIRPGGILFTFSCSQVVSAQDFRKTVFSAAAMSGRNVRILHQLHQPADHPVSIFHPEGEYLKGLVLWVE